MKRIFKYLSKSYIEEVIIRISIFFSKDILKKEKV